MKKDDKFKEILADIGKTQEPTHAPKQEEIRKAKGIGERIKARLRGAQDPNEEKPRPSIGQRIKARLRQESRLRREPLLDLKPEPKSSEHTHSPSPPTAGQEGRHHPEK
ncbi:MAG: hypothetical protein HY939_07725 [Gammaproteobacteria bacterium]|nr:hypothetical protein [Gammaproteobacteria bacterium]